MRLHTGIGPFNLPAARSWEGDLGLIMFKSFQFDILSEDSIEKMWAELDEELGSLYLKLRWRMEARWGSIEGFS